MNFALHGGFAFKGKSISALKQKRMSFIGAGILWNKSWWKISSYFYNFFLLFDEIWKIKEVGPTNIHYLTLFVKLVKIKVFGPQLLHFSDFIWNSSLNHFQQLLFCTIPPPMKLFFLVLVQINFCLWRQTPQGKTEFTKKNIS